MRALLISAFGYYKERLCYIEKVLKEQGYETNIIQSDFEHLSKKRITVPQKTSMLIPVPAYRKNISIQRVISHLVFSVKVASYMEESSFCLVYAILPPNSVGNVLKRLKKERPEIKIIVDVYDMWPESFPSAVSKCILLNGWKKMRNSILKEADYVFLECGYYRKLLSPYLQNNKNSVLYLCRQTLTEPIRYEYNKNELSLCYLGSINNIFDLDFTLLLLKELNIRRKIVIHIIGDGEKREQFLNLLKCNGLHYIYYGTLFDAQIKRQIFSKCHFGLNLYKVGSAIGLTMKSLDYFQAGLPIISKNIYDTRQLIKHYHSGFDLTNENQDKIINDILAINENNWNLMHDNTIKMFDEVFSDTICLKKLREVFRQVDGEKQCKQS